MIQKFIAEPSFKNKVLSSYEIMKGVLGANTDVFLVKKGDRTYASYRGEEQFSFDVNETQFEVLSQGVSKWEREKVDVIDVSNNSNLPIIPVELYTLLSGIKVAYIPDILLTMRDMLDLNFLKEKLTEKLIIPNTESINDMSNYRLSNVSFA